jgi:hypothetical protein
MAKGVAVIVLYIPVSPLRRNNSIFGEQQRKNFWSHVTKQLSKQNTVKILKKVKDRKHGSRNREAVEAEEDDTKNGKKVVTGHKFHTFVELVCPEGQHIYLADVGDIRVLNFSCKDPLRDTICMNIPTQLELIFWRDTTE